MRNHDLDAGGEARGVAAAANGAGAVGRKRRKRRPWTGLPKRWVATGSRRLLRTKTLGLSNWLRAWGSKPRDVTTKDPSDILLPVARATEVTAHRQVATWVRPLHRRQDQHTAIRPIL